MLVPCVRHRFCSKCFDDWTTEQRKSNTGSESRGRCPLCHRPFTSVERVSVWEEKFQLQQTESSQLRARSSHNHKWDLDLLTSFVPRLQEHKNDEHNHQTVDNGLISNSQVRNSTDTGSAQDISTSSRTATASAFIESSTTSTTVVPHAPGPFPSFVIPTSAPKRLAVVDDFWHSDEKAVPASSTSSGTSKGTGGSLPLDATSHSLSVDPELSRRIQTSLVLCFQTIFYYPIILLSYYPIILLSYYPIILLSYYPVVLLCVAAPSF